MAECDIVQHVQVEPLNALPLGAAQQACQCHETRRLAMIQQANARKIEERLGNIENAIASISAELRANGARFYNERLRDSQNWRAGDYEVVVMYKLGHPYGPPPSFPDVHFDRSYPVNSRPPANLLPKNNGMFIEWQRMTVTRMREKLEGIYSFYSDNRFELQPDASK